MSIRIGASVTVQDVVKPEYLATNWKNDFPVLATPILLWLAELVCMKVVEQEMGADAHTVGTAHEMKHLAATPEGFAFTITATVVEVDRKRLVFDVEGHDGVETILQGRHERFLIDGEKFRERVQAKATAQQSQATELSK
ncbi:MAG: thioesterase family protein [Tumebacillaceae bacterium]